MQMDGRITSTILEIVPGFDISLPLTLPLMRRGNTGLYALPSTVLLVVCEEVHKFIRGFEEFEI